MQVGKVGVDATCFQMGGQVFQVPRTTVDGLLGGTGFLYHSRVVIVVLFKHPPGPS